ncbi:unnamed protein product, partial [Prorocentrum cordatum]
RRGPRPRGPPDAVVRRAGRGGRRGRGGATAGRRRLRRVWAVDEQAGRGQAEGALRVVPRLAEAAGGAAGQQDGGAPRDPAHGGAAARGGSGRAAGGPAAADQDGRDGPMPRTPSSDE